MNLMNFKFLAGGILIVIAVFFTFPFKSGAVSALNINMEVIPPNPAAFEEVTLRLNSYSENLDSVLITWSVNGRDQLSGTGKKTLSVKLGDNGSETRVIANIFLPSGTIEKRIILNPANAILLWQATDSYVPPFYKGKAMPISDTEIKVVAMPEIRSGSGLQNPQNMTYSWKLDYTNEQEASGYGKRSFSYVIDYLEDASNVEVVASTTDQRYSAKGSIDIRTSAPKISFYKKDPILGPLFERALPDPYRITEEETIVAIPYFISPKDIRIPFLSFNWYLNNNLISTAGLRKNLLPLRSTGAPGRAKLMLEIENREKIFQTVSRELNLEL